MREILFKGKRVDNGEWVEGYYAYQRKSLTDNERYYILTNNGFGFSWQNIVPETLCQYSGLTDKNGKKIFEGDIISTPKYGIDNGKGQNFSGKDKFVVGYADGTYHLKNKLREFCLRPDSTCEVIGNIFDNPELLEVES